MLAPHAPELAARWAERLFLTARRHERPFWEAEALASAGEGRVAHEDGWLPTWTWTPAGLSADVEPRTVLLVHGWEGRGSQLTTFVPELLAHGLRVVTFDAPGHGDSPLRRASLVEHARAVRSVADAVGPVHAIIAHSIGGAATLLATRAGGLDVERLALVSPPTTPKPFASMFARTLGLDESLKSAMIARLEARYSIRFDELDVRGDAHRLRAPLLVVHDREDPVVPFENGEVLARTAPDGDLLETTGLGHRAILRAPHVVQRISRFVAQGARAASFEETLNGELFRRETRW